VTITAYATTRQGRLTRVRAISSLSAPIYYHWYLDGLYLGVTRTESRAFCLDLSDQRRITVLDTNDPDFDPLVNAPEGWPARRTIQWTASVAADVAWYRVDQSKAGGEWTAVARVRHDPRRWVYSWESGRLDDLTKYAWRVVPMDEGLNDGTPLLLEAELIVRAPDAPNFTATFSEETSRVTFAAA
jgi:hypothetical protein